MEIECADDREIAADRFAHLREPVTIEIAMVLGHRRAMRAHEQTVKVWRLSQFIHHRADQRVRSIGGDHAARRGFGEENRRRVDLFIRERFEKTADFMMRHREFLADRFANQNTIIAKALERRRTFEKSV